MDKEKGEVSTQVSMPVFVVLVVASSVIGTLLLTLIIGIVLGLLCGVKHRPKHAKTSISIQQASAAEENSKMSVESPIYETVELKDKTSSMKLSRNIAYELVKME